MLETSMNVNMVVRSPNAMSESLNGVELVPFRRFSVVDLKRHNLADLVSSTTDNHHERSNK